MEFNSWINAVDKIAGAKYGVSLYDLPDTEFIRSVDESAPRWWRHGVTRVWLMNAFEAGRTPKEFVDEDMREVIREEEGYGAEERQKKPWVKVVLPYESETFNSYPSEATGDLGNWFGKKKVRAEGPDAEYLDSSAWWIMVHPADVKKAKSEVKKWHRDFLNRVGW